MDDNAQFKEDNGGTVAASIYTLSSNAIIRVFSQGESYQAENLFKKRLY